MVMSTMTTDDVWIQEWIFYIYVMVILDVIVLDMCEDNLQSLLPYLIELLILICTYSAAIYTFISNVSLNEKQ